MVVASQYQFSAFVNRNLRALLGTLAIAMTSLNDTIWIAVTMAMMYIWPMNIAPKNAPIMTNVHMDLVMKVCFFFSYSDGSVGFFCRGRISSCPSIPIPSYVLSLTIVPRWEMLYPSKGNLALKRPH